MCIRDRGYEVRVFNLIDPSQSDGYNPFSYIHSEKDVLTLIDNLIKNTTPDVYKRQKETRAKAGYILDDTPQTVKVKSNEVVTVEFRNQPKGNLIIVKQDSVTKEPLEGVEFKITYADAVSYTHLFGRTVPGE